ncbi:uncharacterized protein LOC105287574 [Ooceraea biroi]|nr:uncharacterized protein LOC105287574 [Ooceraea biroi]
MPTDVTGGPGLAVVAGDVLALRGTGLAAAETWALLCQAAQALQDLFLSNGGVVGGSRAGPVVTPHTLELTPRGRVLLQLAPPETARAYLPPEYRPGRIYSDTDSEKMWMYSLGRALLDTTPRVAALTGTVSVSPTSALQSVLAAMTEPDPRRRASLMNLLDVISEYYYRTRLQTKPFTHIVMDMYREVVRSPQYAARKRAACYQLNILNCPTRSVADQSNHPKTYGYHHRHHHHHMQWQQQDHVQAANGQLTSLQHQPRVGQHLSSQQQQQDPVQHPINQFRPLQQQQQQDPTQQPAKDQQDHRHNNHGHYHAKGSLFKAQSRNSQSHPNLTTLCDSQQQSQQQLQQQQQQHRETVVLNGHRTQFRSQLDIQSGSRSLGPATTHHQRHRIHHHSRTYSQPVYTRLQHTRSSGNLPVTTGATADGNPDGDVYSDPIYALPVKPFLSSQDVRVNGLSAKASAIRRADEIYGGSSSINRHPSNTGRSQPDVTTQPNERLREDIYGRTPPGRMLLQRQHSNPQLPNRTQADEDFKRLSQPSVACSEIRCVARDDEQTLRQQNPVSSMRPRGLQGPPKPPRIITTLRKTALSDSECNSQPEPPAKPPRIMVRNGPRARRGKAVQRAPSRLYRTLGGPMRSFNKAQCVGPEFVVRANQPPKTLCVGQVKAGSSGRIVVIMLTGQRVEVTCDPQKVTAGDLFQAIVQAENLDENFTLGLAVLLAGDFAMLPPDTKLNKVAPPGWLSSGKSKGLLGLPTSFMLYLRLRFFLPSLRGIRSWISKHLLYLQIRRCILEQQLVCPYPELINLTGLALQAEFGNYNVNEHGCGDYFLLEHYVPESLILSADRHQSQACVDADTLRAQLHRAHRDRRGMDSNKAEEMFITHAQSLPDYGSHYYIATVDTKGLEKLMAQQRKGKGMFEKCDNDVEKAHRQENPGRETGPLYGGIPRLDSRENVPMNPYADEHGRGAKKLQKNRDEMCNNHNNINNNINSINGTNNNKNSGKSGKRKAESNVWLAIHAQGLKLLERGGEPRERTELAHFQWRDVQTLSYSKSCLVVYSKLNGRRCKFKLRMDHRKSYFAFKLTSLHHQFFLRLRSELTSLQGLAKDFGIPLTTESKTTPLKSKIGDGRTKIAIANTVKVQQRINYPMQLEEYQNKENENPQKDANVVAVTKDIRRDPGFYSSEEDALYAQVNVRLEPEGESRDTEEESERGLTTSNEILLEPKETKLEHEKLYGRPGLESETETDCTYSLPKVITNSIKQLDKPNNPEELYAAINKVRLSSKSEFPVPDEVWNVTDVKKTLQKMKASSLPNYGTPKQSGGFRTPSLPRRLGVKMGTRAIYSSLAQKDTALTDDTESLSLKSDTESSIQSLSARSAESPMPEAYVLNTDIRTDDETFRVPEEESMSASLVARLEELSFVDERILHTIKVERGHGGSIGLQVTEGNDGGVYVQAVSVGGSADMAGNVNKGDQIVAINGQNLLNLRYEDALKMLQSSSETIELVLSQPTSRKSTESRDGQDHGPVESNYLHDIKFDVSSEAETSSMTNKWIVQKTTDVASVQNTSSAYSSAASSAMDNHNNANSIYMTDFVDNNALKSANSTEPPVPPRRMKRKMKIAPSSETTKGANGNARLQQKHPPPLPPPPGKHRRNRSRFAVENRSQCDIMKSENVDERDQSKYHTDITINAKKSTKSHDDTTSARENSMTDKNVNDGPVSKSRLPFLSSRDIASSERTARDGYPPLFFTLRDFEDVMSATWRRDDPVNETSAANLGDTRLFTDSEIFGGSCETELRGMLDDDDDDNVCFRVTTTNLPFEKCLGGRNRFGGDAFDNSTNGSDCITYNNVRKSSNSFDNDDDSDHRVGTKVRFVIESSSPAKSNRDRNGEIDVPCDDLRSYESVLGNERVSEQSATSSVQLLTEIREIKDRGDNSRDKSCTLSAEEGNFATKEDDLFMLADASNVDAIFKATPETCYYDKRNDINYERIRKEDSNSISWSEHIENFRIGKGSTVMSVDETDASERRAAKQMDQKQTLVASSEIAEHIRFTDESTDTACRIEEANAAEITEKKTHREEEIFSKRSDKNDIKEDHITKSERVFIGESLESLLNDDVSRDNCADGSGKKISINDFADKSLSLFDSQQSSIEESEERITNDFADSKNDCEKAFPLEKIFTKSVPMKIRRDSFLETMLADDPTDISIECAAISTQTMMSSSSVDKELSMPSESMNKIRELDTDSARRHLYGFDDAIKAHTENQKVLMDTEKTRGRTIDVSSVNAKSTQSRNKSASDAKNDVLNELLCNFSNIKLKIVSPENNRSARIDDEKNIIARPVTIDNRISTENGSASFNISRSLEECRNEVRDVVEVNCKLGLSIENIDMKNDTVTIGKIMKEDFTKTKLDSMIGEKIAKNKNVAISRLGEASFDVTNKIAKDSPAKSKVGEKDVKSEDIRARSRIEKPSKNTESEVNKAERETKKSRDACTPKTILKKKSAECEQANQFQKKIPIGAPATMNKIFDSKELEMIADASHRVSVKNVVKHAEVVSREAHSRVGEKTDEEMSDEADADPRKIASRSALSLAEDATSSDDKCAIARKNTSIIPCNNNDNNRAVTAVANVSNDQSLRDVVTITSGKVRSFVKYYEIRGDATTVEGHSKINDRQKVAKRKSTKNRAAPVTTRSPQRPEIMTKGKETEGGSRDARSNDDLKTSFDKTRLSSRMPEDSPNNQETGLKLTRERERNGSHVPDKTHVPLAKTSVKKSVQFRGGFIVIRSETFDEDEESARIVDANASRKKRTFGIPSSRDSEGQIREIAKLEKPPDARKDFFPRETVAQMHTVADHGEKSGINRFVTKPETPQLVFYCTV